ncbi:MAG TPA: hypothetical protein VF458_22230 [Ktedonobacteraceae bacterium]
MAETKSVVTLWVAWYRERAEYQDSEEQAQPRRLLRLKTFHATSREEASAEMQRWLEQRGLRARDLERLEPSPYGLQFHNLKAAAL